MGDISPIIGPIMCANPQSGSSADSTLLNSSICSCCTQNFKSAQVHKADDSMVRALVPAGQDEQSRVVSQVAGGTQATPALSQKALNGPQAGADPGISAEKEIIGQAVSHDAVETAGSTGPDCAVANDAAAAAAADGAVEPAAQAEAVTKWVPSPHVPWLEWPEDANERRLSSGATAVVFR